LIIFFTGIGARGSFEIDKNSFPHWWFLRIILKFLSFPFSFFCYPIFKWNSLSSRCQSSKVVTCRTWRMAPIFFDMKILIGKFGWQKENEWMERNIRVAIIWEPGSLLEIVCWTRFALCYRSLLSLCVLPAGRRPIIRAPTDTPVSYQQ
jgi:hypothetical protein